MKDFDGNELKVGDRIAVQLRDYKELMAATITRFTKCKVVIKTRTYSGYRDRHIDPSRVAKIPKVQQDNYAKDP